jgi:hypothetical protein
MHQSGEYLDQIQVTANNDRIIVNAIDQIADIYLPIDIDVEHTIAQYRPISRQIIVQLPLIKHVE